MARQKGIVSHTETKNQALHLRVTAREYAKTLQLANYTNHHVTEILRKFLEDGLKAHVEDFKIINCSPRYLLSIPSKINNNNNNKRRRNWYKPKPSPIDKLDYKKPLDDPLPVNALVEHDSNQVLGIYDKIASQKLAKEDFVEKPTESFWKDKISDKEKYIAKLEEYIQRSDADVLIRELYKLEIKDLKETKK